MNKIKAAAERWTQPQVGIGWVLALLVWLVCEAFDVVELHVDLNPGVLEQIGLSVQHVTGILIAVPAAVTAWRVLNNRRSDG